MILRFFLFTVAIFICTQCASLDLAGKSYAGKPTERIQKRGIIGAGQAGRLDFTTEQVTYILPGSDLKGIGTYTVSADKVTIHDTTGNDHNFTIKEDGKILQWKGVDLRRTDFPWP
ncbi:hypothetical protein [Leptospira kanakyensis]|uniref:Uncharacterized protein n=1 Tax=Leptospira kanakyensis TaxID=2484968 RepID=A0A6N4Q602_9LEPT|nr:hypothetical protein [Leptospira kanakyensis]MCW7471562.1 hypothetical protein [Leptospira kanakyensis]MCW7481215.1 hypothetical protein [Leptospira kanakyensis]TGK46148.1 hypothetical protein EHQ11_19585 [Leptospira kanakyensis]TGK65086.1 hypothetical protein EHQ16_00595 [Leptospira kanakyensis]TGK65517.1 hypothetical protein EHQ18_19805 [Leptospira kanakyensis]